MPVTHERQVERAIQLQDLAVMVLSLGLAHVLRNRLADVVPGLKPAVPFRDYVLLFVVLVPTWAWCAERLSLHRLRTVNGQLIDLLRALVWTQAWGATAIALILVAAQVELNRSFIALFLLLSTLLLTGTKLVQRGWVRARRGRALALLVGEGYSDADGELERLRGRQVEHLGAFDPGTLRLRLRSGGVDEVVFTEKVPRDHLPLLLEACEEIGVPALVRVEKIDLDRVRPRAEIVGPTLYLAYQTGHESAAPVGLVSEEDSAGASTEGMGRAELVKALDQEIRGQSAWTLFFHQSVAERLSLNATDHKCLDMIWRCHETSQGGECMTPGQLARETKLTTGAVTARISTVSGALLMTPSLTTSCAT